VADEPGDCTCGGTIPRERRDGFCSSWCAGRDAQGLEPQAPPPLRPSVVVPIGEGGRGVVSPSGSSIPHDGEEPTRPRYRQRRRLIADEVEEQLTAAGLAGDWRAAAALDLADSLDWTGGSGSARAALHRELNRTMAELLRGVDSPGSAVGGMRNELQERRRRRAAGGGDR